MDEQPREFYLLDELAERWGTDKEDVLRMASSCNLVISARPTFRNTSDITTDEELDLAGMIQLEPGDVKSFIPPLIKEPGCKEVISIIPISVYQHGKQFLCDKGWWIEVFRDDLLVLSDEVVRIEKEYPWLANNAPWQDIKQPDSTLEFGHVFELSAEKCELQREKEERERRPADSHDDYDKKVKAIKDIDRRIKEINEEIRKVSNLPFVGDEDIVGTKSITEGCGYDPEKEVWTAIKRAAIKLGITIRHVSGPRSPPVLKRSECNRILALKVQMEKKRRKNSVIK